MEANVDSSPPRTILPRLWAITLAAAAVAFAWVLLSLVFGFTSTSARADDSAGLLPGVDEAVSAATSTVADMPVVEAIVPDAAVVDAAVQDAVAIVEQPVAAVVAVAPEPVSTIVDTAVTVVDAVAAPVVDALPSLPVLGTATEVPPIHEPGVGLIESPSPVITAAGSSAIAAGHEGATATSRATPSALDALFESAAISAVIVVSAVTGGGVAPDAGMTPLAETFAVGSGASGLGVTAVAALGLLAVPLLMRRRRGVDDTDTPPSLALPTDVSPD